MTGSAAAPVGVVLAGGASRRMGRDKAVLEVGGRSLAGRAADLLGCVCGEVVLADGSRGLLPELVSLPDGPGQGPAAGILGAAAARPGRALLVLACDLPAVPVSLLAELARYPFGAWVVPRWRGGLEPLCSLYRPGALTALRRQVAGGELALRRLAEAEGLEVAFLEGEALAAHGRPTELFRNVNRPEDLVPCAGAMAEGKEAP